MSRRRAVPSVLSSLVALVVLAGASPSADRGEEVRALWVVRSSLTSPESIARVVRDARRTGFNTLLVQVRGRGDAYYGSTLEPRAASLAAHPATFDPLEELLAAGHAAGLRVHAWINVNLIASAQDLPSDKAHLVNRHPDWLMVPRPLAAELYAFDPNSPAYVGKLARWARAQAEDVEGLYASPLHGAAASHVVSVVLQLVRRYAVDGVHLDYIRFPSAEFDYSRAALSEFRTSIAGEVSVGERERLDGRVAVDPFAWVDMFPSRWAAFRRSRLTALVMRIRTAVKAERPAAMLTAAVVPDERTAYADRLQDWRLWAENGLLDAVCPMAYTQDAALFSAQIGDVMQAAGSAPVWAGIGAYRLTPAQTVVNIESARRAGAAGIVLFSYDSTRESSTGDSDYLAEVARAAFADPLVSSSSR